MIFPPRCTGGLAGAAALAAAGRQSPELLSQTPVFAAIDKASPCHDDYNRLSDVYAVRCQARLAFARS